MAGHGAMVYCHGNPPQLTFIAALEGCSNLYQETLCKGGVPYTSFWKFLAQHALFGKFAILEDPVDELKHSVLKHPV